VAGAFPSFDQSDALHDADGSFATLQGDTRARRKLRRVSCRQVAANAQAPSVDFPLMFGGPGTSLDQQYVGKSISKLGVAIEVAKQAAKKTKKKSKS
jgi:hypothetical protein